MRAVQQIFFGTRIPTKLRNQVSHFCRSHGVKLTYFVTQALKDKLERMSEDAEDAAVVEARMKDAEYIPMEDFNAYLEKAKSGKR